MLGAIVTMSNVDVIRAEKIGNDISGHWGQQSIERWVKAGIIQGDGTNFYPNNDITRAEMAVIISNLLGLKEQAQNNFVDLEDKWYTEAILKCNAAGIMLGDGNKVRPNDPITRQEAAVLIGKTLAIKEGQGDVEQFNDSKEVAGWAQGFVTALSELGILKGYDNKIHPSDNISRASVMAMLDRAIGEYITEPGTYEIDTKGIVIIAAPDVILENAKTNSVIILPGLERGEVVIKNSMVKEAIIASGDIDALKVIESVAQGIIIENKVEQVICEGNTLASNLIVAEKAQGISLNVTDKVLLEEVVLKADDVIVNSKGSISNILVDGNNVILEATNTKVIVNEETSNIKVNGVTVGAGVIIADSKDSDKGTASNNSHNSHNGDDSDDSDDSSNTYYVVAFDTGVENININKQSIKNNNKIVQPEVEMIREGYIFEGWYNGSEPWDFTKDVVKGNMTLTAKWKKIVEPVYQVSKLSLADGNAICFRIETEDGNLIKGADLWTGGAESSTEPKGEYIITVNWVDKDGNPVSREAEACDIEGLEEHLSVRNAGGFKDGEKKISNITVEKVKESKWNTENGKWKPIIESTKVLAVDAVLEETKVESIELSDTEITLKVGETKKVTANVKPIMATDKTITIESKDKSIAEVINGEIKGIAPGETTITYTAANGVIAKCKVVVSNYKVSDLSLADKTAICFRIEKEDGTLITEKDLWNGRSVGSDKVNPTGEYIITVSWIDKAGNLRSMEAGECRVDAEGYLSATMSNGFKDANKISNITVKKVKESKWEETSNGFFMWQSVIESTEVLAVDAVLKERELESFELSENEIRIKVGETKQVKAENLKPILTTDRTINVKSGDEAIATVDNTVTTKGKITGIAPGETTITYTAANGVYAECKVVVEPSPYKVSDLSVVKSTDGKSDVVYFRTTVGDELITGTNLWTGGKDKNQLPTGEYIIEVNWKNKRGFTASLSATKYDKDDQYLSVTVNDKTGFYEDKKQITNITVKKVKSNHWNEKYARWEAETEYTLVLAKDAKLENAALKEAKVESIELIEEEIRIKVGETKSIIENVKSIMAEDQTITIVSENEDIVTVSDDQIIGMVPGETTIIYQTADGVSVTCKVVVEAKENAVELIEQIENNDLELTLPTESVNGAEEQLEDSEESTPQLNEKEEDVEAIIGMNPDLLLVSTK